MQDVFEGKSNWQGRLNRLVRVFFQNGVTRTTYFLGQWYLVYSFISICAAQIYFDFTDMSPYSWSIFFTDETHFMKTVNFKTRCNSKIHQHFLNEWIKSKFPCLLIWLMWFMSNRNVPFIWMTQLIMWFIIECAQWLIS